MSRTLNKVMLIGNVGNDPEFRITPNNIPVASFRMATSQVWRDKDGGVKEHTDWHTIVGWRGLAEVIDKLVTRGSKVYVEGKIRNRKFEVAGSGKKYAYEIIAESILMLEQKKSNISVVDNDSSNYSETNNTEDSESASNENENNFTESSDQKSVDTFLF